MSTILEMIPDCLKVSVPVSLFFAFVFLGIARAKMKTVRKADKAYDYLDGDLELYEKSDRFLYEDEQLVSSERTADTGTDTNNV